MVTHRHRATSVLLGSGFLVLLAAPAHASGLAPSSLRVPAPVAPVVGTVVSPVLAPVPAVVAPVVSAAAPVVSAAAPVVSVAAPVVSAAAPVVSAAAPVVSAAAPVVSHAAPVVPAVPVLPVTSPVLGPVLGPVLQPVAPVVSPVVSAAAPVLSPVAPVLSPLVPAVPAVPGVPLTPLLPSAPSSPVEPSGPRPGETAVGPITVAPGSLPVGRGVTLLPTSATAAVPTSVGLTGNGTAALAGGSLMAMGPTLPVALVQGQSPEVAATSQVAGTPVALPRSVPVREQVPLLLVVGIAVLLSAVGSMDAVQLRLRRR